MSRASNAFIAFFFWFFLHNFASANEVFVFDEDLGWTRVAATRSIEIHSNDQISDGCWKTIRASENAVKLEFLRSKFEISDDSSLSPQIILSGLGYGITDRTCAVAISLIARVPASERLIPSDGNQVTTLFFRELWRNTHILTGGKNQMDQRIKETFVDMAQSFLVDLENSLYKTKSKIQDASDTEKQKLYWESYYQSFE